MNQKQTSFPCIIRYSLLRALELIVDSDASCSYPVKYLFYQRPQKYGGGSGGKPPQPHHTPQIYPGFSKVF